MRYIFTLTTGEELNFVASTKRQKRYAWRWVSRHCRRASTCEWVREFVTNGQPVRVVSFKKVVD